MMDVVVRGADERNGVALDDAMETVAYLGRVIGCSVMLAVLDTFNTSHPDDYD